MGASDAVLGPIIVVDTVVGVRLDGCSHFPQCFSGCERICPFGPYLDFRIWRYADRMELKQQVFAHWRPSFERPDDLISYELSGAISGKALASDISYFKVGSEVQVSKRLMERFGLALRVQCGRLFPYGSSKNQQYETTKNRFDQIRFYLGGSGDRRGWTSQLAGEKSPAWTRSIRTPRLSTKR